MNRSNGGRRRRRPGWESWGPRSLTVGIVVFGVLMLVLLAIGVWVP